jgi:hypothetical protein
MSYDDTDSGVDCAVSPHCQGQQWPKKLRALYMDTMSQDVPLTKWRQKYKVQQCKECLLLKNTANWLLQPAVATIARLRPPS